MVGIQGDLEKIERNYLDTIELNHGFLDFMKAVRNKYKLASYLMIPVGGVSICARNLI